MRTEALYLDDVVDAAESIARFLSGVDRDDFLSDELRQSAVLQKLPVIGEAAARLSDGFRDRHPNIKWPDIIGFRNIAVHHYFGIGWETVWDTALQDVPIMQEQVAAILADEFPDSNDELPAA